MKSDGTFLSYAEMFSSNHIIYDSQYFSNLYTKPVHEVYRYEDYQVLHLLLLNLETGTFLFVRT